LLEDNDTPAQVVDLSDVIKRYKIPSLTKDGAYKNLAKALGQDVLACGDKVPIVTGYFGHVPDGLLHSIGRGYTDLCAALVAIGVSAEELQIWKEVDGIFTADPRKVPTARLLPSVSPSEAAELTFYVSLRSAVTDFLDKHLILITGLRSHPSCKLEKQRRRRVTRISSYLTSPSSPWNKSSANKSPFA